VGRRTKCYCTHNFLRQCRTTTVLLARLSYKYHPVRCLYQSSSSIFSTFSILHPTNTQLHHQQQQSWFLSAPSSPRPWPFPSPRRKSHLLRLSRTSNRLLRRARPLPCDHHRLRRHCLDRHDSHLANGWHGTCCSRCGFGQDLRRFP
jgi:hypothetical protein